MCYMSHTRRNRLCQQLNGAIAYCIRQYVSSESENRHKMCRIFKIQRYGSIGSANQAMSLPIMTHFVLLFVAVSSGAVDSSCSLLMSPSD